MVIKVKVARRAAGFALLAASVFTGQVSASAAPVTNFQPQAISDPYLGGQGLAGAQGLVGQAMIGQPAVVTSAFSILLPAKTTSKWLTGTREGNWAYRSAASSRTPQTTSTYPGNRIIYRTQRTTYFIGAGWMYGHAEVSMGGPFNLWGVRCYLDYRFNGAEVWSDNSLFCLSHGMFMNVDTTKVLWNDGGANRGKLFFGADAKVSVIASGFPMHFDHFVRSSVRIDGSQQPAWGDW